MIFKPRPFRVGCLLLLELQLFCFSNWAQELPIDTTLAQKYFQEARKLFNQDNAQLWGISLQGPMMFVDPGTRQIMANQIDLEEKLTKQGEVFVGRLPEKEAIANTSINWAGVKWSMIIGPLPEDEYERATLMVHESWHRIQDDIGFPATSPAYANLL